jgi:hypothetical protein
LASAAAQGAVAARNLSLDFPQLVQQVRAPPSICLQKQAVFEFICNGNAFCSASSSDAPVGNLERVWQSQMGKSWAAFKPSCRRTGAGTPFGRDIVEVCHQNEDATGQNDRIERLAIATRDASHPAAAMIAIAASASTIQALARSRGDGGPNGLIATRERWGRTQRPIRRHAVALSQ